MEIALANKDIERTVLGVSLNNPQAYYRVADTITGDCFTTPFYGKVWGIMHGIMDGGETPDLMAVANALRMDGDTAGIVELSEIHTDAGLSYQGADQYLIDLRDRRNVYLAVTEAQRQLTDPTYPTDEIMQTLSQSVGKVAEAAGRGIAPLHDILASIQSKAFDRMGSGEEAGCNSGFVHIDRLGGLVKSDLTVVAGETSQGKTSFALALALNTAIDGNPVAVYSLEMSIDQCAARLLSMRTGLNGRRVLCSPLTNEEYSAMAHGIIGMRDFPVYFDTARSASLERVTASIRRLVLAKGIRVVVIDYLQLMSTKKKSGSETERIAFMSRTLKTLAVELDICIVLLSQLSRPEKGGDHLPTLRRLRGSGAIEQDADNVFFVYRPAYYEETEGIRAAYPGRWADVDTMDTALIIHAKGRNVGIGGFVAGFDAQRTLFYDIPQDSLPQRSAPLPSAQRQEEEPPF